LLHRKETAKLLVMGSFPPPAASPAIIPQIDHVQQTPFPAALLPLSSALSHAKFRKQISLVSLGTRPGEAESLVGPELAEDAVAGGAEGDGQDEADGEKFDGDLLEGTDALGDGVGWVGFLC
jgi:hypothetical protein